MHKYRSRFTTWLSILAVVYLATNTHGKTLNWTWAKRIASTASWPEGEPDTGFALDASGNLYVTGFFDIINDFGGVILTNQSVGGSDIFVAKYNSTGALQWAQRAGGTSINYGRALGVDSNGNIYVTGGYQGPANFGSINLPTTTGEAFFLAKYNSNGVVQWVQPSTGGSSDVYGIGLAVDSAGNSYASVIVDWGHAAAITFGAQTVPLSNSFSTPLTVLVKYDSGGTCRWAQVMGGSDEVYATKLALDAAGNVYVRGTFFSTLTIGTSNLVTSANSTKNAFLAKFNTSSGALTGFQLPKGNSGEGGVAVDPAGNAYISGAFASTLDFGSNIILTNAASTSLFGDAFLAKYNSAGVIQWARSAGGTNGGFYWALALDTQTNIYAAGFLGSNAAVAQYSLAGNLQGTNSASDLPVNPVASCLENCAVDSAGNCFVEGFFQGTTTFGTNVLQPQETWNFFLIKVSVGLAITTTSLPGGSIGVPYSQNLAVSGGQPPYKWTNTSGTLPPGLKLATNGMISGTPTNSGVFNFTVNVTDAATNSATQAVTLTVVGLTNTPSTDFTYSATNGSIIITRYIGTNNVVVIPGTINNLAVVGIGDSAFASCTILTNVFIPSSVTNIGGFAFKACTNLHQAYFQGNAPGVNGGAGSLDTTAFSADSGTAYYLPGTTGWGTNYGGWLTAQWYQPKPQILGNASGIGARTNGFNFTISWATNTAVVVETSTNLVSWQPVITNSLVNGTNAFRDSSWTNYLKRFYRVRSQ